MLSLGLHQTMFLSPIWYFSPALLPRYGRLDEQVGKAFGGTKFNLKMMRVPVWRSLGLGDVPSNLRLGANILCWVALDDPFLGCSKCSRRFGRGHVGSGTNLMFAPPPLPPHLSSLSPFQHPPRAVANACMYLTDGTAQITGTHCIVPTCRFFPVPSLIIPDIRTMYPKSLQRISCLTRWLTKTTAGSFYPSREFPFTLKKILKRVKLSDYLTVKLQLRPFLWITIRSADRARYPYRLLAWQGYLAAMGPSSEGVFERKTRRICLAGGVRRRVCSHHKRECKSKQCESL